MRMRAVLILVAALALVVVVAAGAWVASSLAQPSASPAAKSADSSTPGATSPTTATAGIPTTATAATVEYVHDGDTLFLTDGRKVRLLGINTPEIGAKLECWGNEATALLRRLLPAGTHVWVQRDIQPLDQYGRSLLFIYTDDATNINLELLRQGAARVTIYRPNVLLRDAAYAAQDAARAARVGLWGAC